jgi:hypothetical protein
MQIAGRVEEQYNLPIKVFHSSAHGRAQCSKEIKE